MTAIDVMRYAQRLSVQVNAQDGDLRLRGTKASVDRLASLVKQHKRELIIELESANQSNFNDYLRGLPQTNPPECWQCTHLRMRRERQMDSARVWFWRCAKGYTVREIGVRGQRLIVPPPECDKCEPWQPGENMSSED